MTIDCTLDNLKIPALPTYVNEFGTKKQDGGLTTAECTDDAMLPFRKMRPYEINEDAETTEIQHNAVFVAKAANITLTLHDCSDSFLGCEARVINVSSGNITVKGGVSGIDGGTAGITVPAKREIRLIFLSDGWHSSYDDFCNITEKEIADSAVTTNKIKDSSVMNSKIGETLTIANGGTGATTATQAINNLAAGIDEDTADGSDTMGFITTDSTSIDLNADDKKIYKRSGLRVWNWIKGKVKAVLGLDETSLTTKTITSTGTITASTSMTSAEFHANSYFPKDNVDSFLSFIQQTDGNSFIRINTPHKVSIEPGEGLNVSGNCTMAKNLTVNGSITATEFKGDVKGNADTATAVLDCGNTARTIKIGYAGITLASCRFLAAYNEDGSQICSIPLSAVSVGNADTVDSHHFNWAGKDGQPTWVWGGDDSENQYVYNPSNFNVNYANSAGSVAWSNVSGKPAYITGSYSNGVLNLYTN